jgi:tetratricopeptide (TPR) repeat protein
LPESSTGKSTVIKGPIIQLALLAVSLCGFGQQAAPSQLEALLANAQTAQSAGNFAEAANSYKRAIGLEPGVPQLWANLGLVQQQEGNYTEAIFSFLQANRLNPSLYVPNLFLGIDYAHTGKEKPAVPYLIRAERINKSDPQAPLALGRVYVVSGDLSGAVVELERATDMDPKLSAAWFTLGIAYLEQVEEDAKEISEPGKESSFAGALYAASLQKQGRFGEAASLYESLLNTRPQPRCLRSELGFSLFRNHDEAGAKEAFATENVQHPECSLALLGEARLATTDKPLPCLRSFGHAITGLLNRMPGRFLMASPDQRLQRLWTCSNLLRVGTFRLICVTLF